MVPGNVYHFTIMVVDAAGNWDVLKREFTTLGRKLTVRFPKMRILNDGDPSSVGEGEFWFRVSAGDDHHTMNILQDFHLPTMDIDDWSETGRPYVVGFGYVEDSFASIPPDRPRIWVASWGKEHDGPLESDEGAGNFGMMLSLPTGQNENVPSRTVKLRCPTTTVDDDFNYEVDVTFSVEYGQ
ncbi:hypothetical protein AJ87_14570 [Rhizobium yanglingense]|nr:hypothetical protein AJ87_14570 [Rhizobium yanglingense]